MRHQFLLAALLAGSFAGGGSPALAQVGDRVIPIPEITEEAVARIDLQDGTVAEWWDILGEPALTITDFEIGGDISAYDPADMDFVIWLGWRQLTNHLYVAVTATGDLYDNEFGADVENGDQEFAWDIFAIAIDGDHSGGNGLIRSGGEATTTTTRRYSTCTCRNTSAWRSHIQAEI